MKAVKGVKGLKGLKVVKGVKALKGLKGLKGVKAVKGVKGLKGLKVVKGVKALKGLKWLNGQIVSLVYIEKQNRKTLISRGPLIKSLLFRYRLIQRSDRESKLFLHKTSQFFSVIGCSKDRIEK